MVYMDGCRTLSPETAPYYGCVNTYGMLWYIWMDAGPCPLKPPPTMDVGIPMVCYGIHGWMQDPVP